MSEAAIPANTMYEEEERVDRVRAMLDAARRLADACDPLGQRARRELPEWTGLHPEGIELGISRSLETAASDAELASFVRSAPLAARAHVLLSANVFIAPARAIALAMASAREVLVRPSRREPLVAELLLQALIEARVPSPPAIVDRLDPRAGDLVYAYGREETLRDLSTTVAAGARLRGYGPGFGVALIEAENLPAGWASRLALDVAAFDQRGCLSPRLALLAGDESLARSRAQELAAAFEEVAARVPRGRLSPEEGARAAVYRDTVSTAGTLWAGSFGGVGLLPPSGGGTLLGPDGRYLHCVNVRNPDEAESILSAFSSAITMVGCSHEKGPLRAAAGRIAPSARVARLGDMQRPPFDGPVDRRPAFSELQ